MTKKNPSNFVSFQMRLLWLAVDWVLIRLIILLLNDDPRPRPAAVCLLHATTMVTHIASTTTGITIQGTMDATSTSTKVNKLASGLRYYSSKARSSLTTEVEASKKLMRW